MFQTFHENPCEERRCTHFVQCSGGMTFEKTCPPGTVYNSDVRVARCDHIRNVPSCQEAWVSSQTERASGTTRNLNLDTAAGSTTRDWTQPFSTYSLRSTNPYFSTRSFESGLGASFGDPATNDAEFANPNDESNLNNPRDESFASRTNVDSPIEERVSHGSRLGSPADDRDIHDSTSPETRQPSLDQDSSDGTYIEEPGPRTSNEETEITEQDSSNQNKEAATFYPGSVNPSNAYGLRDAFSYSHGTRNDNSGEEADSSVSQGMNSYRVPTVSGNPFGFGFAPQWGGSYYSTRNNNYPTSLYNFGIQNMRNPYRDFSN